MYIYFFTLRQSSAEVFSFDKGCTRTGNLLNCSLKNHCNIFIVQNVNLKFETQRHNQKERKKENKNKKIMRKLPNAALVTF